MSSRHWMPLYVAEYIADTMHLTALEHGAYLLLIMHYWQKGRLPDDDRKLASIARVTPEQWSDMRSTIAEFFEPGWTHTRIDSELKRAQESYERRAAAGRAGGKAKAAGKQSASIAKARPEQSQSHSPTEKEGSNEPSSPEPGKPAPVVVIGLPTVSDGDFPVTEAEVAEWSSAYPAVDVRQQLAAMRQWLIANPTRRKTKRGMRKFVVSWLDRRQNVGPATPNRDATAPPRKPSAFDAYDDIARMKGWINEPASLPGNHEDAQRLSPAGVGGHSGPSVDLRRGYDWHPGSGDR